MTLSHSGFLFPTALSAEQCTGDELAQFHTSLIEPGLRIADLTAGLGIDCFHMATKATHVTALDISAPVAECLMTNAITLGLSNIHAECIDCCEWLARQTANSFDLIFIDPARRGTCGQRLFSLTDCQPDVVQLLPAILRVAQRAIIKMSPMLDIDRVIAELPGIASLHIIGTRSECKELLAEVVRDFRGEPKIYLDTMGETSLSYYKSQLPTSEQFASEVKPGDLIGEPWPGVIKARPRGLLSGTRLHPDTQLWLNPASDFPGKVYQVTRIEPFSSSIIKRLAKERIAASITVRNLPITAAELRTRLKAAESSTAKLFGATCAPACRLLLFCTPCQQHHYCP